MQLRSEGFSGSEPGAMATRASTAAAALGDALDAALGGRWTVRPLHASGFTATWRADAGADALFVKTLPAARSAVLDAEADGLAALAATAAVRVPAVRACTVADASGLAMLALEWLDLAPADAGFGARLGAALATLHAATPAEGGGRFGWRRDNMIGGTPQRNRWSSAGGSAGWIEFFGRERLGALQARLAARGADAALVDAVGAVIDALPGFFDDGHVPRPSLIHGDLWSGNWAMLGDGTPVVYDPAVSVSDAEAELAMMELFGAPPPGFRAAYREAMPAAPGSARRRPLYQLYHLLNHALLFGGGYAAQALALARALLH
jgi:fructosamine-3-kinase